MYSWVLHPKTSNPDALIFAEREVSTHFAVKWAAQKFYIRDDSEGNQTHYTLVAYPDGHDSEFVRCGDYLCLVSKQWRQDYLKHDPANKDFELVTLEAEPQF